MGSWTLYPRGEKKKRRKQKSKKHAEKEEEDCGHNRVAAATSRLEKAEVSGKKTGFNLSPKK